MDEEFWKEKAESILKSILIRRRIKYHDLAIKLQAMGIQENQNSISNKLNRGTFSFVFFLQCMEALNIKDVRLD